MRYWWLFVYKNEFFWCYEIEIWILGINWDLIDSFLIVKYEVVNDNFEGEDMEEFDDVYLI